ncbi:MAG: hypothetical protein ABJC05_06025 [Pyrinomonadaceae bacterium]
MKRTLPIAAIIIGTALYYDGLNVRPCGQVADAAQKRKPSKPQTSRSLLTQTYEGFAITVEAIERSESWDDNAAKVHLTASAGDEFIVVYVSAKRKGKEDGVFFEHFELIGAKGVKGEPALLACGTGEGLKQGPFRYSTIMNYVNGKKSLNFSQENPELSIVFTIKKGSRLKTLKLGTLSFDISAVKVTPAES